MSYSVEEVIQYIKEEDVKFIRLAFCDVYGNQKNISIMPKELEHAFEYGIAIDGSAISGFGGEVRSDLFLFPDPATISVLPWRPEHGKVVRMFCNIKYPNGKTFEADTRSVLKKAVSEAQAAGLSFAFGSEIEFYLFKTDEEGEPTDTPYDKAGYMDIAPEDKGENVRREICLTLERMGIRPETSHHEEGPGQNEIDFRYSDPITAADNAVTFCSVVRTIAARNGLYADLSPKPIANKPGNGFHINFSIKSSDGEDNLNKSIAGILKHINDITVFLNPTEKSYDRLGNNKAPKYISWSSQNRSQLIRIPASPENNKRAELRSPDPSANPYLAFALLIYACMDGIKNNLPIPDAADINLFAQTKDFLKNYISLPNSLSEAKKYAVQSNLIKSKISEKIIEAYCN